MVVLRCSLAILLTAAVPALALEWLDGTAGSADVGVGERSVSIWFPYRNDGDRPVAITGIVTGCNCSTASLSAERLEPGESGMLVIRFTPEHRRGVIRKRATVRYQMDGGPREQAILTMEFEVDRLLVIDSGLLGFHCRLPLPQWKPVERSFTLSDPSVAVTGLDVSEAPHFAVSLRRETDAGAWVVRAEPVGYHYGVRLDERVYVLTDHPVEACRRIPLRCFLEHRPPRKP